MDFMTGMVLLQQELNRKTLRMHTGEWSLRGTAERPSPDSSPAEPLPPEDCRAVRQSDRRSGPRRLAAFVLRRPDVAGAAERDRSRPRALFGHVTGRHE